MAKQSPQKNPAVKTPAAPRPDYKLSLVVPCYNESHRLHELFGGLSDFVKNTDLNFEIILVDDGSTDNTAALIQQHELFSQLSSEGKMRLVRMEQNGGKGAALKKGVAESTGTHILTLDADMSARPSEIKKWMAAHNNRLPENEIWIGSREHKDSQITEAAGRRRGGRFFNFVVRFLTPLSLPDTQCGFKLYPAPIGKTLFSRLKNTGWGHDVELLYRAKQNAIPIRDLALKWDTKEGSKISVLKDGIKTVFGILAISIRLKLQWYFFPFGKKQEGMPAEKNGNSKYWRTAFAWLLLLLLIKMPALSFHYGMTGDELAQKHYGEKVLSYYTSFGHDQSYMTLKVGNKENLYLYGGLFDMICAAANKWIGHLDPYDMRHLINSLFGWLAILFTGMFAFRISNWRMAFFAVFLLGASPQFIGQCMNNPKDIPFAATYAFTLWALIRFVQNLPRPVYREYTYLILGIALSIATRVGGLMLIGFIPAFIISTLIFSKGKRTEIFSGKSWMSKLFSKWILVSVAAYAIGMLLWPYGLSGPTTHPFSALQEMTNFAVGIRTLFNGAHIWSTSVPWNYVPTWIIITAPIAVLLGAVTGIISIPFSKKFSHPNYLLIAGFTVLFPWAYAVYKHSALYDGWRQFLFIFPPLCVLAAAGWEWFTNILPGKIKMAAPVAMIGLLLLPMGWSLANHPNEASYFNEFFGGTKSANGLYETDYWANSAREACDYFVKEVLPKQKKDTVIVATNCADPVNYYLTPFRPKVKVIYVRYYSRDEKDWDFGIFNSRTVDGSQLQSRNWPSAAAIHNIEAGGVPLTTILERKDKSDLIASRLLKTKQPDSAVAYLHKALKNDPKYEIEWLNLMQCYLMTGKIDSAKSALNSLLAIDPENISGMSTMGQAYLNMKKTDEALKWFQKVVDMNPMEDAGYMALAQAWSMKGDINSVIANLEKAVEVNATNAQAWYYLAQVYRQRGDTDLADQALAKVKELQPKEE